MLERIAIAVLSNMGPWLITMALEYLQKRMKESANKSDIKTKVENVEKALLDIKDGTPMTKEQKDAFKKSVRDLVTPIRGNGL